MKVNRSRFLLLTAALAGGTSLAATAIGGCTVNNTNVNGDGGTTQDGSVSDGTTGDGATGDSATSDSSNNDGGTCDDTTGSAPDCAALADAGAGDGGGTCVDNAAFVAACPVWAANLKPGVARKAVNCAVALPSCESGAGLDTCLSDALNQSCADTTADAVCMSIAATCADAGVMDAGVSPMTCDRYVSGLNAAGRTELTQCFAESGGCTLDFSQCVAGRFL